MPAPRILHIFPGFAVGGAQVRTARLVEGLGGAFEHALVSLDGDRAGYGLLAAARSLEWVEPPPRAGSFTTARALAQLIRARRPDVVATYNWGAIDGVIGARLAGRRACVHHEDGFGPQETRRRLVRRNLWRAAWLRDTASVVVPSEVLERIARREWHLPAGLVHLVPNGVDLTRFAPGAARREGERVRAELGLGRDVFVLVSVGGLRPEKRPDRLLEVAALLPGVHTFVVGDGALRADLERRAARADLAGRVHFFGACADPRPQLAAADLFVLPSDTEQMPIAMVEAMALGLPVAATDVGDVRVILPSDQHGGIVPLAGDADTAAALARVALEFARDPARRRAFGARAAERAADAFGFDRMARRYAELYTAAAARDRRS
jgi:glycosyltransferase involved in cell wall biosynthesis